MNEKQAVELLRKSENYKVLEHLQPVEVYQLGEPEDPRLVMVLDTETTGLDTGRDKIIELGFVVCRYDAKTGFMHDVVARYDGFEDPGEPLVEEVKELTGINDEMLIGQTLDDGTTNEWLAKSDLIIAHNAGFDRKMVERRFPQAEGCNWGCSVNGVDWRAEGVGSAKLDYLGFTFGYFFDGHRAVNDAEATLHLLSMKLPKSGMTVMSALLESARKSYVRFLVRFNYNKDAIASVKSRGYRWMQDKKLWHRMVESADQGVEMEWLEEAIYKGNKADVTQALITAKEMYSIRA